MVDSFLLLLFFLVCGFVWKAICLVKCFCACLTAIATVECGWSELFWYLKMVQNLGVFVWLLAIPPKQR
jgi:hypothetical protein